MSRVLLISNEPVLATGLTAVLAPFPAIQLEVSNCLNASLVDVVRLNDPDVLLLDFDAEHFPLLLEVRKAAPQCKVVLWMRGIPIEVGCQTMRLGVRGILRKTVEPELILSCLEKVASGGFWFDTDLAAGFLGTRTVALTRRESQIVPLIAQGLKNKQIAAELSISEATIRIYLSKLFRKLGVADRYELAIYGIKNMMPARGNTDAVNGERHSLRYMVLDGISGPAAAEPTRKMPIGLRERASAAV